MHDTPTDITVLLRAAASGERQHLDALMAALYQDMRRLAAAHLSEERASHTLSATALVHEAYVRLIDQRSTAWNDRLHFFAIAARIIRRILIDHARARSAAKRGGGSDHHRTLLQVQQTDDAAPDRQVDLLALDEALEELAAIDEQQARIVELRYFGGCTVEEVAALLNVGKRTVDRDWQAARAWLLVRLQGDAAERGPVAGKADHHGP